MNLFEKLNRLDDSLVESKRVVKKKKLTESLQKKHLKENYQISDETWNNIKNYADLETTTGRDFAYDGPYADEVGSLYGTAIDQYNEEEGTNVEYQASIQNGRGASELFDDQGRHAYRDFETECDELLEFARGATCLEDFMSSLVNYIYSFAEDLEYEEEDYDDYDDDIDEMLTESTEQYELSTLVKDSINHLVNDLSKDPMADDFGDDVCADLEDNYDIYVPENPVKYADWCDAVMSEVSRQLNNKEELTESKVFDDMQGKIEDALASNKSLQFLIEPCSDGVLVRFLEGEKNAVLDAVDKLDNKGFDISPAGQEFDFNFIVKGFTEQGAKQLTI